jgi:hypothetical protein
MRRSWFDCGSTASVNRSLLVNEDGTPSDIWDTGDVPVLRVTESLTTVSPQLLVLIDLVTVTVQLLAVQVVVCAMTGLGS